MAAGRCLSVRAVSRTALAMLRQGQERALRWGRGGRVSAQVGETAHQAEVRHVGVLQRQPPRPELPNAVPFTLRPPPPLHLHLGENLREALWRLHLTSQPSLHPPRSPWRWGLLHPPLHLWVELLRLPLPRAPQAPRTSHKNSPQGGLVSRGRPHQDPQHLPHETTAAGEAGHRANYQSQRQRQSERERERKHRRRSKDGSKWLCS